MKKLTALFLALLMLVGTMSCTALAEAPAVPQFRGITYGSSLANITAAGAVDKSLLDFFSADHLRYFICNTAEHDHAFNYEWDEQAKDALLVAMFCDDVEVAGHDNASLYLKFYRPVVDQQLCLNDDDAIFYGGLYVLYPSFDDRADLVADLKTKLTTLYGTPKTKDNYIRWYDGDQVEIVLAVEKSFNEVRLSYLWLDAQTAIEEAFASVSTAQPEQKDISQNTTGL